MGYLDRRFCFDHESVGFVITESNIETALLAAGTVWNSHSDWYDEIVYCPVDGEEHVLPFDQEMIADSILLAMCYISNKTKEGFSLFSEKELGLPVHSLKAMKNGQMFHAWFAPYKEHLSAEGKELYQKMLQVFRFYLRYFGINANKNVGLNELKLALMQRKVNATYATKHFDNSHNSNTGARVGAGSKWTPSRADKLYNTNIFTEYDCALVVLMTKQYERFIAYGMIDAMPSCVR